MAAKTQEVGPKGRRWVAPLLGAVVLAALAALGARMVARRGAVLSALPARPDLGALPAELGTELDASEAMARGYLHSVAGLETLSRLYHANGFYNEAMECYGALRALEPGNGRWPHLEANILAQFGRQEDALPREEAAVALAPGYIPARLRLGDEYLKANERDKAAQAYGEVLARSAGDPYAELGLAKCDVQGGAWDKARDRLDQTIRQHPDFIGALSLMVTALEHQGDQAAADALKNTIGRREFVDLQDPWVDDLMDDCFDSYRLSVAAAVADFAGTRPRAEAMLERAIAFSPTNGSFHRQLAVKLALDRDLPSACLQLESAVALSPTDNDAWLLLSQYKKLMGKPVEAEQALRSGLAHCPDSSGLHLEEAKTLAAAGRNEEAIGEFREAFQLNPSESGPLVQLAGILISLKRGDEAVDVLTEALGKQPEDPEALATLTFYYISAGNEAAAKEWWGHVRRQPRTPADMVASLRQAYREKFGQDLD